jgi:hypothetical protein
MLILIAWVGLLFFMVARFAAWLAFRHWIDSHGLASYRELMRLRGIDTQNLAPFWKYCFIWQKRTARGSK